ncbi:MAG TPA: hypothetical protein VFA70_00160 [Dehalococcoidia bacterium]|jgi:hypothetical protein|nr:hypothetical protein [Dehalococcoidia bacterium]
MHATRRRFLLLSGGTALALVAAPRLPLAGASTARAQALPGAPSFTGAAGTTMVGPITLSAGLTILRAQHNGAANFGATLFLPAAGETAQQSYDQGNFNDFSAPFNLIGAVKAAGVVLTTSPGDHYIIVSATGAWQISVEQPLPENVTPVQQTVFSGKGQNISPYFTVPDGISTISVQTASNSLYGWLYHLDDLGGEPVEAGIDVYDGRIFDFTFPGNVPSVPLTLPDNGPYLIAVANTLTNSDAWTITLS